MLTILAHAAPLQSSGDTIQHERGCGLAREFRPAWRETLFPRASYQRIVGSRSEGALHLRWSINSARVVHRCQYYNADRLHKPLHFVPFCDT